MKPGQFCYIPRRENYWDNKSEKCHVTFTRRRHTEWWNTIFFSLSLTKSYFISSKSFFSPFKLNLTLPRVLSQIPALPYPKSYCFYPVMLVVELKAKLTLQLMHELKNLFHFFLWYLRKNHYNGVNRQKFQCMHFNKYM